MDMLSPVESGLGTGRRNWTCGVGGSAAVVSVKYWRIACQCVTYNQIIAIFVTRTDCAYYFWQMQQHRIFFFFATAACTCISDLRKNKNKAEETVADEMEANDGEV